MSVMQEILQKYTARQLRLAFLTQLWNSKVDFSESLMTGEVRGIEITFNVRAHRPRRFAQGPLPTAGFVFTGSVVSRRCSGLI